MCGRIDDGRGMDIFRVVGAFGGHLREDECECKIWFVNNDLWDAQFRLEFRHEQGGGVGFVGASKVFALGETDVAVSGGIETADAGYDDIAVSVKVTANQDGDIGEGLLHW